MKKRYNYAETKFFPYAVGSYGNLMATVFSIDYLLTVGFNMETSADHCVKRENLLWHSETFSSAVTLTSKNICFFFQLKV